MSLLTYLSQTFLHNLPFTIFPSQSFFHNLSFAIFILISAKCLTHRRPLADLFQLVNTTWIVLPWIGYKQKEFRVGVSFNRHFNNTFVAEKSFHQIWLKIKMDIEQRYWAAIVTWRRYCLFLPSFFVVVTLLPLTFVFNLFLLLLKLQTTIS